MPEVKSSITAKLQADKSIDGILTLGAPFAATAVDSVKETGSKAKIGTFDLNKDLISSITSGAIQFAVDQQPYLQGYEAVDELWLLKNNGNVLGGGRPVLTGPAIVTKENAAQLEAFANRGRDDPGRGRAAGGGPDERLARRSPLRRLLGRPELGALLGAVALFVFFSVVADAFLQTGSFSTVLYASSTFGIMAVGVSLLMIGGEFDLSAGVMVTSSALIAALTAYQLTLNVWAGVVISLVLTLALGMVNGVLYVRTKLPSFIITLATFFMLAGLNLGVTKALTGNVASDSVRDMDGFDSARAVFASDIDILGVNVKITVFWWLLFVAIATWILLRTRTGNWIFAAGGAAAAPARSASRSPA